MNNLNKINFKHFTRHIILGSVILLVLLFGNCRHGNDGGLMITDDACGRDHWFKQMIIRTMSIETTFETPGETKFAIISTPFKLSVLVSIVLLLYVVAVILKKENTEHRFMQLKKMLNISFWLSFSTFFVIFIFSLMFGYT